MTGWTGEIAFVSFSRRGAALAERLQSALGGAAVCAHAREGFSLAEWTAEAFAAKDALVFVGAVGIAVRAVGPLLNSKARDPAVVAVDERGQFAVAVASGHLGGANDLARAVAAVCGGTPVITTATDVGGVFAADQWARRQNCAVADPRRIKGVSAKALAGETLLIRSLWPVAGEPPAGVELTDGPAYDVLVDIWKGPREEALCLVPRAVTLGIGCRRGTGQAALERAFRDLCESLSLREEAVCGAASIDLKAEEPGLLAFCASHGWSLKTYSPGELRQAEGAFTSSAFVEEITGVDNVCERSAVLAAGGPLLAGKRATDGVTLALAARPIELDWRWQDA